MLRNPGGAAYQNC